MNTVLGTPEETMAVPDLNNRSSLLQMAASHRRSVPSVVRATSAHSVITIPLPPSRLGQVFESIAQWRAR